MLKHNALHEDDSYRKGLGQPMKKKTGHRIRIMSRTTFTTSNFRTFLCLVLVSFTSMYVTQSKSSGMKVISGI